jgi:hypothetical protein
MSISNSDAVEIIERLRGLRFTEEMGEEVVGLTEAIAAVCEQTEEQAKTFLAFTGERLPRNDVLSRSGWETWANGGPFPKTASPL